MRAHIVLGTGYGDEGKGKTVAHIASKAQGEDIINIRFNGGHQAGHTVIADDKRHVHSQIGSAASVHPEVNTFISQFCTFDPSGYLKELKVFNETRNRTPLITVSPQAHIVTPLDKIYNQQRAVADGHGSCGVGFGATIQRNTGSPYRLHAIDIADEHHLYLKLKAITTYYDKRMGLPKDLDELNDKFIADCSECAQIIDIDSLVMTGNSLVIFEGAQGFGLDMDHGYFPQVTYSNTTCKNALELCRQYGINARELTLSFVTRAYSTRHGLGPLYMEGTTDKYFNYNLNETNVTNTYQGEFRKAPLNLDMFSRCVDINSDLVYQYMGQYAYNETLAESYMTCIDQIKDQEEYPVIFKGKLYVRDLKSSMGGLVGQMSNLKISSSEDYKDFVHAQQYFNK